MFNKISAFNSDRRGSGAFEYALIAGLLAAVVVPAANALGDSTNNVFSVLGSHTFTTATTTPPPPAEPVALTCADAPAGTIELMRAAGWLIPYTPATPCDATADLALIDKGATSLPAELQYFTNLQSLTLSGNNLTTLPAYIVNFNSLTTLWLDDSYTLIHPQPHLCELLNNRAGALVVYHDLGAGNSVASLGLNCS